ncbi:MAG: hypothetical protein KAY90_04285 [Arenimonas sp.]|nr:hypothetical protein [Arenimonas sp.]
MPGKTYASFADIDQELEILALEKQLQLIKLRQAGRTTLSALSPSNLLLDSLGSAGSFLRSSGTLQKFVIMLIARKFLK